MKRRGLQPMHDQHVNVTPLVDVVMCLIIFFLICGQLVAGDITGGVKIPEARNGQDMKDLRGRVVLNVKPAATPDKPPTVEVGERQFEFPYEGLADQLRKAVSENRDVKVIIRADKDTPYQFIFPIMRICSEVKAASMHFATQDEP